MNMPTYIPVIGLEIHAELKTRTKMFCDCKNDPEEKRANTNICPTCTGQPGALPVMNKEAIEAMLKIGTAIGGEIPAISKFDRKNYFYPDLPKGYQISQYDLPFVFGGSLAGVRITRVHLEEDTGRLQHGKDESGKDTTLVDYNRAGVPLMELVTEPDIREVEKISEFASELQLLLRYLGVSDADIEKGQMRVEVNLSLGTIVDGELKFGTKVEVKNIASFKMAESAARYEIERQKSILESGASVEQETRGWSDLKGETVSQRKKESSHDYRYFPEPDLPALDMSQFDFKKIKLGIPELPQAKRLRLEKEYGLNKKQAEILVFDRELSEWFESVASELRAEAGEGKSLELAKLAINYLTSDIKGLMAEFGHASLRSSKLTEENFADLILLADSGKINSRSAKDILRHMYEKGGDPVALLKELGLEQVSDEAELMKIAEKIVLENPKPAEQYKAGKEEVLMFFVGRAMGQLKGSGNPKILQEVFKKLLK